MNTGSKTSRDGCHPRMLVQLMHSVRHVGAWLSPARPARAALRRGSIRGFSAHHQQPSCTRGKVCAVKRANPGGAELSPFLVCLFQGWMERSRAAGCAGQDAREHLLAAALGAMLNLGCFSSTRALLEHPRSVVLPFIYFFASSLMIKYGF